jgi:hypothetical protein
MWKKCPRKRLWGFLWEFFLSQGEDGELFPDGKFPITIPNDDKLGQIN